MRESESADTRSTTAIQRPEEIAERFVSAWNDRDADAIAALFDTDAEFVNVVGLWWHNSEAIREAHAYGLRRIFSESTVRIISRRVRQLTPDVAVVHADLQLLGQTRVGDVHSPMERRTIFTFVVHRTASGWSCASAHNTDVVPGAETNVADENGLIRGVSYRAPEEKRNNRVEESGHGSFPASDPPSWTGTTLS